MSLPTAKASVLSSFSAATATTRAAATATTRAAATATTRAAATSGATTAASLQQQHHHCNTLWTVSALSRNEAAQVSDPFLFGTLF